jgi:O-antigen/teichoic acid export membrane protein
LTVAGPGKSKRAAAIYIVLAGLQRFVSLLILPFITHAMSPKEYGAASMLAAASLLLVSVVATPLMQLIIRAAARGDDDGPALIRIAGAYCYVLLPVVVAAAAAVVALAVPEMLGVSGYLWAIEMVAIGLQPAASVFALSVAQAREDLRRFVWLSSVSVVVTAASKLVFVVILRHGVLGWVISDLISALVSALLAMWLVRLPHVRTTSEHIRYGLRFTLPLIPHTASLWALTSLSRPALAAVSTLEQVGFLSFGLSLAQLAGIVLLEVNRAVLPRYSRETFPAPTPETHGPARWQVVGAFAVPAVVGVGVAVAGPWLFAAAFWPSFQLTGVLLIGQAALGLYVIPMNYLTQTGGVTRFSAVASGTGAALILVSILIFGGRYGALGLAYATAAGYLTMAVLGMILLSVHKFDIAWSSWFRNWPEIVLAIAALASAVAALSSQVNGAASRLFAAGALLLIGAIYPLMRRHHSVS